ncbi:AAA family ATPase [Pseudoalteromonas apostichopi]|uniref:AAA family ATPase n=1 Tax=Pseudoalteromonas apostichopi TaxID=3035452 RepID=UPI0025747E53|nr:AAA family ATPase [Pseudoalteromonas sp. FE4]
MKLQGLNLASHDVFGDIEIPLARKTKEKGNFKTVVIGPNGTGKSNLLRCIADALTIEFSEDKTKSKKDIDYEYEMNLYSDNNVISINSDSKQVSLPIAKLLAVTSTPQDRFPFVSKKGVRKSEEYVYLGLKTASNNIFFSNLREELLLHLFTIYKDKTKTLSAANVLQTLNFSENFKAILTKGRAFSDFKTLLFGDESSREASDKFETIFDNTFYSKSKDIISRVVRELENNKNNYPIDVKLEDRTQFSLKVTFLDVIEKLLNLNILSVSELALFSSNGHDMNQASSGEYNILKIFLSIIANIENNSVILIDEPEISLHPNWQMDFISILDLALSKYTNCHSIIATHSHFLISNVNAEESMILNMSPSSHSRKVQIEELEIDPFGWSPENILYRVFGVTALRNKYFELDLRIIIDYVASPKDDHADFIDAIRRVRRFNIGDKDPLFPIISKANKLYEELED